jgi:hypothetical protein
VVTPGREHARGGSQERISAAVEILHTPSELFEQLFEPISRSVNAMRKATSNSLSHGAPSAGRRG